MIDAHVHLWQLGAQDCIWPTAADGVLFRDFAMAELVATLDDAGVDRAVLVQSQESPRDTAWLLDLAASTHRIAGVVGWADLCDARAVTTLSGDPLLKGLRPMVQARAANWYDDPALRGGFTAMAECGLVLDALIRPAHLPALARLAERHPDLVIVIDHAAKPEGGQRGLAAWRAAIAPLAGCRNVHVKLSGLLTEMSRPDVARALETLLELFGAERLLWGSDWPVVTATETYRAWLDLASALVPEQHHLAVFGGNAARIYAIADIGHG